MHNFCNKELEYYKIFEMHQTFYKIITHKYFIFYIVFIFCVCYSIWICHEKFKTQKTGGKKINVVNKICFVSWIDG